MDWWLSVIYWCLNSCWLSLDPHGETHATYSNTQPEFELVLFLFLMILLAMTQWHQDTNLRFIDSLSTAYLWLHITLELHFRDRLLFSFLGFAYLQDLSTLRHNNVVVCCLFLPVYAMHYLCSPIQTGQILYMITHDYCGLYNCLYGNNSFTSHQRVGHGKPSCFSPVKYSIMLS